MSDESLRGTGLDYPSNITHTPEGTNHCLLIGIDTYAGNLSQLSNPLYDLKAFKQLVQEQFQGRNKWAFKELFNKDATVKNIHQELRRLKTEVEETDNIIIYFAGHGDKPKDEGDASAAFYPYDTDIDNPSTTLTWASFIDQYAAYFKAFHVLVIIDCCYGGAIKSLVSKISGPEYSGNNTYKKSLDRYGYDLPSRYYIVSGRSEPVNDGEPFQYSPFSNALQTVLSSSTEMVITLREVMSAFDKLPATSIDNLGVLPTRPDFSSFGSSIYNQNGQFVFFRTGYETVNRFKLQDALLDLNFFDQERSFQKSFSLLDIASVLQHW